MKQKLLATVIGQEYVWEVDVPDNVPDLVIAAARKGFQEWLQDAASTAKPKDETEADDEGKATPECRKAAMDERFQKIKDGTYTPGHGGGRGSSLSDEDKALHQWLNKNGQKGKMRDLQERLMSAVRVAVLAAADDEEREALMEDRETLNQLAEENREAGLEYIKGTDTYKDILALVKGEKEVKKAPVKGIVLGK